MQRSILILSLCLSLVVFLSVVVILDQPQSAHQASKSLVSHGRNRRSASPPAGLLPQQASADAARALGTRAFSQGRYDEALAHFLESRTQHPEQIVSHTFPAITLLQLKRLDEARRAATDGLAETKGQVQGPLHFVLACVYAEMGDDALGSKHLRQAHEQLGEPLMTFAGESWATGATKLSAYREIMGTSPARSSAAPK